MDRYVAIRDDVYSDRDIFVDRIEEYITVIIL